MISIEKILELLPHRYPALLVDRVLAYEPYESIEAIKNVTINEPFFTGHFPGQPIMPGVLILESMAQACGILGFVSMQAVPDEGHLYMLVGSDKVRFRQPVVPGDQLHLKAKLQTHKQGVWKFQCTASVAGVQVASADLTVAERK